MNETELQEVFEALTRNPAPSSYDPGSVRVAAKRRRNRTQILVVAGCTLAAVTVGALAVNLDRPNTSPMGPTSPTSVAPTDEGRIPLARTSSRVTESDLAVVTAFVRYAEAPDPERAASVPFTPQLQLGASTELRTIDSDVLGRRSGWQYPPATASTPAGGFDLLAKFRRYLESQEPAPGLEVGIGDNEWCTGSNEPRPLLDGLRRLTIQPAQSPTVRSVESLQIACLDWFSISVYLNAQGNIAAVVSDAYNPDSPQGSSGDDAARSIGARFIAFAQDTGEADGLPVDTPLALYVGNKRLAVVSADESSDPNAYLVCVPDYAQRECPQSAVRTVADNDTARIINETPACLDRLAPDLLPQDVGASGVVVLGEQEPYCLTGWAVEIFFNDLSQIVAVNLLMGSP